jgi:HD-GYP domain-containing protein (c-di-GMP phosphodiesterase class II)
VQRSDATNPDSSLGHKRDEVEAAVSALSAMTYHLHPSVLLHQHDTGYLAARIARELSLGDATAFCVEMVGQIHDIGLNGVTPRIIDKDEPLSEYEHVILQLHPERGASVLAAIPALAAWAPIVRSHHERFDGHGYPDGLCGEEIPLESRLLAVADAFLAMTTPQKWRSPISPFVAVQEILRGAGTQFDPDVAAALIRILRVRSAEISEVG